MPLTLATERFRGYPTQIEGKSPGDLDYDYDRVSLTGPFQHQRGNYTHLGNVTALVNGIDDRYAIFGSGEEIATEFDAAKLPALPPHWKRDYFFYANGYVKDMDWWDAMPFTVAQLPFHKMSDVSVSRRREVSRRCERDRLSAELERPLRLRRAGALVSLRLSSSCRPLRRTTGTAASQARHVRRAQHRRRMSDLVLLPAARQLEMLRAARDLGCRTRRSPHSPDRAARIRN